MSNMFDHWILRRACKARYCTAGFILRFSDFCRENLIMSKDHRAILYVVNSIQVSGKDPSDQNMITRASERENR